MSQSYIDEAGTLLRTSVKLPPGYTISWSGQYEAIQRVRHRLTYIVPLTLLLILFLLYMNTRSMVKTMIVLLAVPFSAIGAVWFLYLAGYNMSIAVWVGLIALLGVDAETGVFMLLYLDLSYDDAQRNGRMQNLSDLHEAIVNGAARRLRPKFMTFATTCIGLFPDHVGGWLRFRCDEAYRRSHGGRHFHFVSTRTLGVSGDLRDLEVGQDL